MRKGITDKGEVVEFPYDLMEQIQLRAREAIEVCVREELDAALGSKRYERGEERRGYRNGFQERVITTTAGSRSLRLPRARIEQPDGSTREFHSQLLAPYARRTRQIDDTIICTYLSGANSRRIRKALGPLLGEANLSKSAVARVVGRLKELFETWQQRDLSQEYYAMLFLDGFHLKVRIARRVVSVPILAVMGIREDGRKVLVDLRPAASEAATHWEGVLKRLQKRGLAAPQLLVVDGHAGLNKALAAWPGVKVQRCTLHKLRNLLEHCPPHARPEMTRDYHAIVRAQDGLKARAAYDRFVAKWSRLSPAVAESLQEAGLELLGFYEFPKPMWKSLRSTNGLENLNREFRRRTKTQASFSSEDSAVRLLYGLVALGQIEMNKIDGYRALPKLLAGVANASAQSA